MSFAVSAVAALRFTFLEMLKAGVLDMVALEGGSTLRAGALQGSWGGFSPSARKLVPGARGRLCVVIRREGRGSPMSPTSAPTANMPTTGLSDLSANNNNFMPM